MIGTASSVGSAGLEVRACWRVGKPQPRWRPDPRPGRECRGAEPRPTGSCSERTSAIHQFPTLGSWSRCCCPRCTCCCRGRRPWPPSSGTAEPWPCASPCVELSPQPRPYVFSTPPAGRIGRLLFRRSDERAPTRLPGRYLAPATVGGPEVGQGRESRAGLGGHTAICPVALLDTVVRLTPAQVHRSFVG